MSERVHSYYTADMIIRSMNARSNIYAIPMRDDPLFGIPITYEMQQRAFAAQARREAVEP